MSSLRSEKRWNSEGFLKRACLKIEENVDWDSLDSGRLHQATSMARTYTGEQVIIGVLERASLLPEVIKDAAEEKRFSKLERATLWLYIPRGMKLNNDMLSNVELQFVE